MPYKIVNKLRQIQNVLVKDMQKGSSKTLTLMPKGKNGAEKTIQDQEMTEDIQSKKNKGYLAIQTIGG